MNQSDPFSRGNVSEDKLYEAVVRSLEALKHLQSQEGWKLYMAMLDGQKASLMSNLENHLLNGDQIVRTAGGLSMHRIAAEWVPAQIVALEKQLKTIVQKRDGR